MVLKSLVGCCPVCLQQSLAGGSGMPGSAKRVADLLNDAPILMKTSFSQGPLTPAVSVPGSWPFSLLFS